MNASKELFANQSVCFYHEGPISLQFYMQILKTLVIFKKRYCCEFFYENIMTHSLNLRKIFIEIF